MSGTAFSKEGELTKDSERDPARTFSYESEDQSESGVRKGMRVRHRQFGVGTVIDVEDHGDDHKVTVRFSSVGTKKLLARFAGTGLGHERAARDRRGELRNGAGLGGRCGWRQGRSGGVGRAIEQIKHRRRHGLGGSARLRRARARPRRSLRFEIGGAEQGGAFGRRFGQGHGVVSRLEKAKSRTVGSAAWWGCAGHAGQA